jgi:predicted GNAT superfamily acetyltransferase
VDHYGPLSDGLKGTDESDRFLLRWDLLAAQVRAACDEGSRREPAVPARRAALVADGTSLVAVHPDIEDLRTRDPAAARDWRLAVRDVLGGLLADGARVVDFDRSAGGYVLVRGERRCGSSASRCAASACPW